MQKLKYVSAAFGDGFLLKLLVVLLALSAMVCVTANSLQSDLTHLRYQCRQLITCMQCFVYVQPLALILGIAIIIIAVCRYDNECLHSGLIKHHQPSLFLAFFCQFSLSISSLFIFLFTVSLNLNLGLPLLRLPSSSWE